MGTLAVATPAAAGTTARDDARSMSHRANANRNAGATDEASNGASRYVAVVDRIVDGAHVVLLLERDGELVDQHVEPRSSFDEIDESDTLHVVIADGELLTARRIPERPADACDDAAQDRFDDLAEPLS